MKNTNHGVMLNAYPDSLGGNVSTIIDFLRNPIVKDAFRSFYILPSIFNTDLDRGFSVIDYSLNELYATKDKLEELHQENISFKFDFILNHASVLSPQFQDILNYGTDSKFADFFINWNSFWDGYGTMTDAGYIQPDEKYIEHMFFRKPGLPILFVRFPDGSEVPYWNTFYQQVYYPKVDIQDLMKELNVQYSVAERLLSVIEPLLEGTCTIQELEFASLNMYQDQTIEFLEQKRKYLGQMDLNIKSPLVWEFYEDTLNKLSNYGAEIVRLDAFAYAPKQVGEPNFFNEPGTWDLLEDVRTLADKANVKLLPEIHSKYEDHVHDQVAEKGYMIYDFFLPGLLIDAFVQKNNQYLNKWMKEIIEKKYKTVNMLGCHDGIPLLDLKGLLKDEEIQNMIDIVVSRGGHIKDLHGKKNMYYQVNGTYYSALGEDDDAMLAARALQMFFPGKPQVWYLDLFFGKNDYIAMEKAGVGGHKEINRTNLSVDQIHNFLDEERVQAQLSLLRFRNTFPAFTEDAQIECFEAAIDEIQIIWRHDVYSAKLKLSLSTYRYEIEATEGSEIVTSNYLK